MKRLNKIIPGAAAAIVALAFGTSSAHALNITISDGFGGGGSGVGGEVGETEPGTINNHSWDNEAFVIKGNKLVLISGFNFLTGNSGFGSGDIFINTVGPTPVGTTLPGGNGYQTIVGNMGYEYALHMDIAGGAFNVVDLTTGPEVNLRSGYYRQNDAGNPYLYLSGGTTAYASQGLTFLAGLSTAQIQSAYGSDVLTSGENNFVLELDMSWFSGNSLLTHYTFGCDNDVITGQATGGFDRVPDGGSTLMLLGFGMTGLGLARGRFTRKS